MTTETDVRTTLLEELAAAEIALQALNSRIADLDLTVTPEEVEAAERAVRFAQARVDQLPEIERRQKLAAAQKRADILRDDMPKRLSRKDTNDAHSALYAAMGTYLEACQAYEASVNEVWNEILSFGDLAADVGFVIGEHSIRDSVADATYPTNAHASISVEGIVKGCWKAKMHPRSRMPFDSPGRRF